MQAWYRISAILMTGALLSGCFTSKGSLYQGVTPLQPFQNGAVLTRDRDGKPGHFALRLEKNGAYRFTITDPGDDFGEGYLLRFFPLKGAPSGTLVFEALEICKPGKACAPVTSTTERLYGIASKTSQGAAVSSPDCPKDSALARQPGVISDSYGSCAFSSRAALESALAARAATGWKPDTVYSYY